MRFGQRSASGTRRCASRPGASLFGASSLGGFALAAGAWHGGAVTDISAGIRADANRASRRAGSAAGRRPGHQ